jgi:hypothetical protein
MASVGLLDRAGRRRSQATLSGFHQGRVPRNKGLRYPPDPPTVQEIIESGSSLAHRMAVPATGSPRLGHRRPCPTARCRPARPELCVRRGIREVLATQHLVLC